ncbi:lymphatic vessel endothelial hyaluronic receptor 1b isoform X2 [Etheostoma spectabile]|uniref:lymphatic vessel endothelial hyaluronic receptor 1b isoform X2 n=1 Tax=Etheostoma spectabile TaxID=54343 RepID=UPI0013AFC058|nr:lymphatic vessel endothelial hyaluronic acid receptor 1-like isoform X2 [Etheostoma spectabile]
MARFCFFTLFLLSFAAFLLASNSSLIKVPQSHRAAGVFMLLEGGGKYTFNFTAARAACSFLNVTLATRAQMERAVQRGLETCKFGWIAEQIAVVPRLRSDSNCGKDKIGVVTWSAKADKKFGVFCFNASDLEETPNRATASPQSSTLPTTLTALTQTPTPAPTRLTSTTKCPPSRKPITTKASEQTPFTSAFTLPIKTTRSTRISSTFKTLKPFPTHIPTSLSHLITSKPTDDSFDLSTLADAPSVSVSSESVMPWPTRSAKSSLGDVPTALIILGIISLLLAAAGVVWYYKLNIFTYWSQRQQKDDIETEMWKHTDSEMDLHSLHEEGEEEEEEESDRKYSSDITLCVHPDIKSF